MHSVTKAPGFPLLLFILFSIALQMEWWDTAALNIGGCVVVLLRQIRDKIK